MPLTIESLTQVLTPELLEQLAIPAAALLAFMWLFSRRRSEASPPTAVADAMSVSGGDDEAEDVDTGAGTRAERIGSVPGEPEQNATQQDEPAPGRFGIAPAFARYARPGQVAQGSLYPFPVQPAYPAAHPFRATVAGYPTDFIAHPIGYPALPTGFTQQVPAGFPQLPVGFPQLPAGFPPPPGFPPLPEAYHARAPAPRAPPLESVSSPGSTHQQRAGRAPGPVEPISRSGLRSRQIQKETSFNTLWNAYRDVDSDTESEVNRAHVARRWDTMSTQPSEAKSSQPSEPKPAHTPEPEATRTPARAAQATAGGSSKGKGRAAATSETKTQSPVPDKDGAPLPRSIPLRAGTPSRRSATPRRSAGPSSVLSSEPQTPTASGSSLTPATSSAGTATPSRYMSPPDSSKLSPSALETRFSRRTNERPSKRDGTGFIIYTVWFESSGTLRLSHPPDLRRHPELQEGDLFYHSLPGTNKNQVWIWVKEDGTGPHQWLRIYWGHVRDDGLYLTLTPTESKPSWVPLKRYQQRTREIQAAGSPLKEETDDDETE